MRVRGGARLAAAGAVIAWVLGLAGCGPSGEPTPDAAPPAPASQPAAAPRHVLLISIDTLRADHLGCYGYAKPTSPALVDALAAESIVFENAWATAPWTLPSHASLLTGLYPSHHGARRQ